MKPILWTAATALFLMLISCKKESLTIADLDLTYVSGVDTVMAHNRVKNCFVYSGNDSTGVEQLPFAMCRYDTLGKRIYNKLYPPYTQIWRYSFNIQGLLKQFDYVLTDSTRSFKARYEFDPEHKKLTQYWYGAQQDTCLYLFNDDAKLIKSYTIAGMGNGDTMYKKAFEYGPWGNIQKVWSWQLNGYADTLALNNGTLKVNTQITDYHYAGHRLDSIVEVYRFTDTDGFTRTTTFDANGLELKARNNGGNYFVEKYTKY